MTDLMQKTKKELVTMLQEMEMSMLSQQNEMLCLQTNYDSVLEQLKQHDIDSQGLTNQNEILVSENHQAVLEQKRLQDELNTARIDNHQNRDLTLRLQEALDKLTILHDTLKKELESFKQNTEENAVRSTMTHELFKSFVDSDTRKVILIDVTYAVCYINRSAATHLQLPEPNVIVGRRLFDFFEYQDALKLKKKIDKAFFSGEKEKIREIAFRNLKNREIKIDMKLMRVRYQEKPSIRITIK
ncbi:MAG: PAS domain-containing protein [Desulfatirhabdiaceae bacterium]